MDVCVGDVWRTHRGGTFEVMTVKSPLVELRSDLSGSVFQIGAGALIRLATLVSRAAEPEERAPMKAPASCPHYVDETDCDSVAICNEVKEVYAELSRDPDSPLVSLPSKLAPALINRAPRAGSARILTLAPMMPNGKGW